MKEKQMKTVTNKQGVRLAHLPVETAFITLKVILPVGLNVDCTELEGLHWSKSHIVEHLIASKQIEHLQHCQNAILSSDASTYEQTTEYTFDIRTDQFEQVFPGVIQIFAAQKFNAKDLERELQIIDIEGKLTNSNAIGADIDDETFSKRKNINKREQQKIEKETQKQIELLRKQNSRLEVLQEFYEQQYTPDRMIISQVGGSQQQFDALTGFVNGFFASYPEKQPQIITLNNEPEFKNPSSEKYAITTHKSDKTGAADITIYIETAKPNTRTHRIAQLYRHFLGGDGANLVSNLASPLDKMLVDDLKVAYYRQVEFAYFNGKQNLVFYVGTTNDRLKKAVGGLRTLVDNTAKGVNHTQEIFEQTKQDFLASHLNSLLKFPNLFMQVIEGQLIMGKPVVLYEQFEKEINSVTYDEFKQYANYIATTSNFKISANGNSIFTADLKQFEPNILLETPMPLQEPAANPVAHKKDKEHTV